MPPTKQHRPQRHRNVPPGIYGRDTTGSQVELHGPVAVGQAMLGAGFPKNVQVLADGMGVVNAESAFGTNMGPNPIECAPGKHAEGWWQLCGYVPPKCSHDINCSTEYAHKLWRAAGNSFARDWPTWHPGVGDPYIQAAKNAIELGPGKGLTGTSPFSDVTGAAGKIADLVTSPFSSVADAIGAIVKFIARLFEPSFWVRVGKGLLGVVMLIFGMVILTKSLLGVDLGGYAEGIVGTVGGKRVRALRAGANPVRRQYQGLSTDELRERARVQQEAREGAKTRGQQARKERFFRDVNTSEPPF